MVPKQGEDAYARFIIPRPNTTIYLIAADTKEVLLKKGLWDRDDSWTKEVMRELAAPSELENRPLSFEQVMFAVKSFAPKKIVPLMNEYALAVRETAHVKDAFEYAALFKQEGVLRELLEWHQDETDLCEWVKVYRLLLDVISGKLTDEEIVCKTQDLRAHMSESTLDIRLKLLKTEAQMQLGSLESSPRMGRFSSQFEVMEDGFTKSVLVSLSMFAAAVGLLSVEGEMKGAERCFAAVTINGATPESMLVTSYHGLGLSTLLTHKETCLQYFELAIFHAKQAGLTDYCKHLKQEYYPFARNVHGEQFDLDGVVPEEQVHQYVVRGEYEQALRLIEKLEATGEDTAFLTFYKGKAMGSVRVMQAALEKFQQEKRTYMIPVVKQEIGI